MAQFIVQAVLRNARGQHAGIVETIANVTGKEFHAGRIADAWEPSEKQRQYAALNGLNWTVEVVCYVTKRKGA